MSPAASPLMSESGAALDFRARAFKKELLALCQLHGLTLIPVPDPAGYAHAVLAIVPSLDHSDLATAMMPGRWKKS